MTTLEPLVGRDVAQKGDLCVIDYDASLDGKDFPGSKAQDITVEVAPGELVEANLPQLEGVKLKDKKDFDYTFPADYRVEDVKGKTAKFSVTLKELKSKKVPALDDAFAEATGAGVHTFEGAAEIAFRKRPRARAESAQHRRPTERDAIINALIERNKFEVPRAMVDHAMNMMLENALQIMARSGMDPNTTNMDWNKLREDFRPRAESEVRGALMFEALAKQEKIEVSDEDVEKKLETIAEESGNPLSAGSQSVQDAGVERRTAQSRARGKDDCVSEVGRYLFVTVTPLSRKPCPITHRPSSSRPTAASAPTTSTAAC